MQVNIEKIENIYIFSLEGNLDSNTSGNLEKKLIPAIDQNNTKFILDFSKLHYISSAGLRVLLGAAKKLNQFRGKLILCSVKSDIKEVFEIAGLLSIFPMCDDPETAARKILE
ncbi:MAG: STAS domain-containing protein [Candidatus Marinimicrobia bacterium]|nr:STAS domain-containing protein [bacterium]MCG2716098.1 STAS domain-containing protein [Candidatus Neomarinimicrobiota bacterium]